MISAECHSDDQIFKIDFDAEAWFEQADDQSIIALAACGWCNDYPADDVAMFMADKHPDIEKMFDYLSRIQGLKSKKDECGFECYVNEASAMYWLRKHRPVVAEAVTAMAAA